MSAEHVAFALASESAAEHPVAGRVREYGDLRGWGSGDERRGLAERIGLRRRPACEPTLQREIERAAAGGDPDVRAVLRSMHRRGELVDLSEFVSASGLDLAGWLGADDD
ncbi:MULTISPECIES: hypothetical protein [Microbacterium]|uniref:hypothetical protein n=1 Tax=Microbacterium TaxID=33882 RepID=UPI0016031130|nr:MULTISPECIES: hypothetical protein [Microbacterium]WJM16741.1 hypothetical protein QUC20_05365 [Microbacterium arborescens]